MLFVSFCGVWYLVFFSVMLDDTVGDIVLIYELVLLVIRQLLVVFGCI